MTITEDLQKLLETHNTLLYCTTSSIMSLKKIMSTFSLEASFKRGRSVSTISDVLSNAGSDTSYSITPVNWVMP
ncbi:Hypothetical protein SRAE_0000059700 [Strongyloides ratti]|uniref:Uncharacterized protein n=1 Tax=Strongyloides ratti TaxID=34506 RepID=A0A090MT29_STRRB|nr:Hypothetical protein SRAE_0000059700 [Strongyloides ratti]CEF61473.1 Hypothetical protein SRAE_0000059700 [Strongyloides ratti]